MKILHTSDWHLGRSLYGRKRYDEFAGFLDWLSFTIEEEGIDALLIAGDVFDTSTPGNRAQELYYRFLCRVSGSCCRHIVVIAGNHDSPSFLNAPKELLRALNVYVVGAMTENPEDEVIVISDAGSEDKDLHGGIQDTSDPGTKISYPEKTAIICAVPYLRDKDIRMVEPGESIEDKNKRLVEGIKRHYAEVVAIAQQKRKAMLQESKTNSPQPKIPIIVMGHLFTAGGKTIDGDGVRQLYVGSLAHVSEDVFPPSIDYLALGHLHVPQCVGGNQHVRYCGSPIPMGFGEASQQKSVVIVDFGPQIMQGDELIKQDSQSKDHDPWILLKKVPCFQRLDRIVGSADDILERLQHLIQKESRAWLEIEYTGSGITGNLREMIDEAIADSSLEICLIKNRRVVEQVISTIEQNETLDALDAGDVFVRCLDTFDVPEEEREDLTASYNEIINGLLEEDKNAE